MTLDVPSQEAISRDNVTVKVNAVVYFRVLDPGKAIIQVEDYRRATWQIAQTTLRNVIGQSELDEILAQREKVNQELQQIIDSRLSSISRQAEIDRSLNILRDRLRQE